MGLALALPGIARSARQRVPFVARRGTQLVVGKQPWRMYGASSYGTLNPGGLGTIEGAIGLAVDGGLNTIRLVNFFDESGLSENAPYDEASWARVDAMLSAMSEAGLRAILDLSAYRNHLQNLSLNQSSSLTPYGRDWEPFVRFVARRQNTATGVSYSNDPTIAVVSLAGEPNPPNSEEPLKPTTAELTSFYERTFAQWRRYDKNHLLSNGGFIHLDWEEKFNNPSGSGIDWRAIFALRANDVPTLHTYFSEFPPTAARDFQSPKVSAYCAAIRKPWITEEFGFKQAVGDSERAAAYQTVYDIQESPGAGGAPSAGVLFWNLGMEVHPDSHDTNPGTPATWAAVVANA
jgi:endo-1,4-beta-mannosidase